MAEPIASYCRYGVKEMIKKRIPLSWSNKFGLALSPMFEPADLPMGGEHHVLLDGGHGSFGLSVMNEDVSPEEVAGWAWSSDLPHHVAINQSDVQVVRWDAANSPGRFQLNKVEKNLEAFYHFLRRDRLNSNRTVVQHLVNVFARLRSLSNYMNLSDERTVDAFVTMLADLISEDEAKSSPQSFGLPNDAADLRAHLASPALEELMEEIRIAPSTLSTLTLYPSLAIRHAGGQIFQEAHFDLVSAPPPDMFGYVSAARAEANTRGGMHFTPPALARSIADQTIRHVEALSSRLSLVICDPACGSGAFLHEAIRALRRADFQGELKIIGNDVSAAAITMARFTLTLALRDWKPAGGAVLDVRERDSLAGQQFPAADVVVMNPPFISAIAQSNTQKAQLRDVVGEKVASRGDYSMAFVTRALESLSDGGVLGTLFPSSLLAHQAAAAWRERLSTDGDIRLLASIGDFGMFSHALVRVACAVIRKSNERDGEFAALITANDPIATGDAFRELRKAEALPSTTIGGGGRWHLFAASTDVLHRQSWRMLTPEERAIYKALEATRNNLVVGDLFGVSQGIQTGLRKALLLKQSHYTSLPRKEKRFFRQTLMTDSIRDGKIVQTYYLFFPHTQDGSLFENEEEVSKAVPHYFRDFLKPNEARLRSRASISRSQRSDWWGLMHPREFSHSDRPRIISKFFGSQGSFVCDWEAAYLAATAHVWIPKVELVSTGAGDEIQEELYKDVLLAYTALFNSRVFMRLVSIHSNAVAGGQFDLSSRFVKKIHLPNLWEKVSDSNSGRTIQTLSRVTKQTQMGESIPPISVDRAVAQLYGVPQLAEV